GQAARRRPHRGAGACGWPAVVVSEARRRDEGGLTVRLLHLLVIGFLVFAAAYVYRINMDSTVRTEQVLKLHAEIHEERDKIAALHSEWARLDSPQRLQGRAERHLPLKPLNAYQYSALKHLSVRRPFQGKPC